MHKKYRNRLIALVAFLAGIFVLQQFGIFEYLSLEYIVQHHEALASWVDQHTALAVLLFCLLYIAIVLCMLPITPVLNVVGGYVFGVFWASVLSLTSALIGASIVFLCFRYVFADWLSSKYSAPLKRFADGFRENGISFLLSLQLFPATPFFVITLCAALVGISLVTFIWTTALGILPITIIYCLAGRQLAHIKSIDELFSWQSIAILLILSLMALAPTIIKYFKKTK